MSALVSGEVSPPVAIDETQSPLFALLDTENEKAGGFRGVLSGTFQVHEGCHVLEPLTVPPGEALLVFADFGGADHAGEEVGEGSGNTFGLHVSEQVRNCNMMPKCYLE